MLARAFILTPFQLTVPINATYTLYTGQSDKYAVQFSPPVRSDLLHLPDEMDQVFLDGKPAASTDVITITFQHDSFLRDPSAPIDPPKEIIQGALDWFVGRLRYIAKAPEVKTFDLDSTHWHVQYLNDDGSELNDVPGAVVLRGGRTYRFSVVACDPVAWDMVYSLPTSFEPPAWHSLLLDARASLPHVGSALVLAATALEVFISDLLDQLVKGSHVSQDLWTWINARRDKAPSVEEQYDGLLKIFTGHSLKEELPLWDALKHLKSARNSFVHEGIPKIGRAGEMVTMHNIRPLIDSAESIVSKIREWIPTEHQWPIFDRKVEITVQKEIVSNKLGASADKS